MDVISYKEQKARKQHLCDWCGSKINIGQIYSRSFCKEDDVYVWKNHIHCEEIASELNMFDNGSVTESDFVETIQNEYMKIMSEKHNDVYESKDFKIPNFEEQLQFTCQFYNIKIT